MSRGCKAGAASNLTYCGSATANPGIDKDHDYVATCEESGLIAAVVRCCLETECEGDYPEAIALGALGNRRTCASIR